MHVIESIQLKQVPNCENECELHLKFEQQLRKSVNVLKQELLSCWRYHL